MSRTELQVVKGEDGVPQVVETQILTEAERDSKIDEIIRLIDDPDSPLAPIKRLIAAELAKASRLSLSMGDDSGGNGFNDAVKIKALETRIKALRELGKELLESDTLSKKDFLNFDGPKLGYVLDEYRQGAHDALKKIGIDEGTIQQFIRHWRDLMIEREAGIRKATDKLAFEDKKQQ